MSKRRLVAIMFTDIEGYTALMQKSEEEAFLYRETHRKIFNNTTGAFNGEIIQYYGDGTLSIFDSAVDAVQCGIAMQRAFGEEPQIPVRIGIHSGDIVISEDDIIGDGVNLASRVESLAVPGSVFISDKVFDEIKNSDAIATTFLDTFKLKNVAHPVGIYAISNDGLVVPSRKAITGKLEKEHHAGRQAIAILTIALLLIGAFWGYQNLTRDATNPDVYQAIAVLPFYNFTGSEELNYFIDGMHSSLIANLGRISALRVTSVTTCRTYKDTEKSIPEIAAELGVDAILEVSVFGLGDSIYLQPKLLGAIPEEQQIWVQDYHEVKSQIINLYQRITKEVLQILRVSTTPEEESFLAQARTVDKEAYDLYLKGRFYLDQGNASYGIHAFQSFKRATEIEPDWAPPYAGLANIMAIKMQSLELKPSEAIPQIYKYLNRALELDPHSADSYYHKALIAVWTEWDWEKGEAAFRKCLELEPNHALCRVFYAHLLTILRRTDEALEQAKRASELDPLSPYVLALHGMVLTLAGECEAAIAQFEKALSIDPDHRFTQGQSGAAFECIGDYETAFELWKRGNIAKWEEYGVTELFERTLHERGWIAVHEEVIRLNEEEWVKLGRYYPLGLALLYTKVKNYDKAVAYFEEAYELHDPNLPYISNYREYDHLKDHPGYRALLKKMNLPTD